MAEGGQKTVYVGGFGQEVNDDYLFSTFATFGDIVSVNLPVDQGKRMQENPPHRGFGFIEFQYASDALDAVDNMHLNQINGRVLKVNLSKPKAGADKFGTNRAVWEDQEWLKENLARGKGEGNEAEME